jgi:transcriptional regulator
MHPNPIFRQTEAERSLEFALAAGFGQIMVSADPVPLVAHIPFLQGQQGDEIELHLVRSNPISRLLQNARTPAKLSVSGPHGCSFHDWYGVKDQAPTWNYVAVHMSGTLRMLKHDQLLALIDRLSAHFEAQLAPKPVWKSSKMTPEILQKMLRQIVLCSFKIEDIQSTWKLNQNKTDMLRLAAADAVEQTGVGSETIALAALIRAAGGSNHGHD